MAEPSTAELMTQLREYQANLAQVNALVLMDPTNAEYLEIQKSLVEGIQLSSLLLQQRHGAVAGGAGGPSGGAGGAMSGADFAKAVSEFEKAAAAGPRVTVDLIEGVAPPPTGDALEAGYRVEVRINDPAVGVFWFPAVIQSAKKDEKKYSIRLIGNGDVRDVDADDVRKTPLSQLKSIPVGDLRPNTKVMAKYYADSKFYAARIEEKVPGGWKVTYLSYNNSEIVPYEYIRAMPKEEGEETEDFKVPDHLKVLETDTDAEKKRKKKAIKALKNNHRIFTQEKAQADKKSSWQQFINKSAKKSHLAVNNPLKRESIFKTPEAFDGKVGVVGSGSGMTDFDSKKRMRKS